MSVRQRQKNVGKSFANTSTNHSAVLTHTFFILSKASRQMCPWDFEHKFKVPGKTEDEIVWRSFLVF